LKKEGGKNNFHGEKMVILPIPPTPFPDSTGKGEKTGEVPMNEFLNAGELNGE